MYYKVLQFYGIELNIGFEHHEETNDIEVLEVMLKGENIIEWLSDDIILQLEEEIKNNENN